jgi:hypothetical protein
VTNIPGPPPEQGADQQALEEEAFVEGRGEAPELVEARRLHALDVIAIRRAFMRGVRHVAYVLPILGLAMLGVWLWHLLTPTPWRWLPVDEVSKLQALLFSGAVSALATAIATKKI